MKGACLLGTLVLAVASGEDDTKIQFEALKAQADVVCKPYFTKGFFHSKARISLARGARELRAHL